MSSLVQNYIFLSSILFLICNYEIYCDRIDDYAKSKSNNNDVGMNDEYPSINTHPQNGTNANYSRIDGNDTFLITSGYPWPKKDLSKYIVSVRSRDYAYYYGDDHLCGGSIIGVRLILTAAHCFTEEKIDASDYSVVVGARHRTSMDSKSKRVLIEDIRCHQHFNPQTMFADICLLELNEDIELDNITTAKINLPTSPAKPGTRCTIYGWGRMYENGPMPDKLLYADVIISMTQYCDGLTNGLPKVICAGDPDFEKDACYGDSGGPLICNEVLAGIVSYGYGCAPPDAVGVYTDVYSYSDWIQAGHSSRSHSIHYIYILIACLFLIIFHEIA